MTSWIVMMLILVMAGLVLLLAEVFLPTHGVLGVLGIAAEIAAVWMGFTVNQWLGAGLLLALAVASPFMFSWAMRIWPRTPVGRRMVLTHAEAAPRREVVAIGATGITMTELRPMGEGEFGSLHLEVMAERGVIPAGTKIRVVSLGETMPIVRRAEN